MKKLIQILFLTLVIGCAENQHELEAGSSDPINSDKAHITGKEVIRSRQFRQITAIAKQGDIDAYNSLRVDYMKSDKEFEILVYALILAHKYDDAGAFRHVYDDLAGVMRLGNFVDSHLASLAVSYLFKAAEMGDSIAIRKIEIFNMHPNMDNVEHFRRFYRISSDTIER
jgi:hypothetical protein